MIDNHTMQVIASDLVPIVPYETTVLDIGMGEQRTFLKARVSCLHHAL